MSLRLAQGPLMQQGAGTVVPLYDAILAESPVAYWLLDDSSGTSAPDETGNGHTGTYTGTYSLASKGGPDSNSYVDLNGGYVAVADAADLSVNTTGTISVVAFVYADASGTTLRMILSKFAASNYEWAFYTDDGAAGRMSCSIHQSTGAGVVKYQTSSTGLTPTGQWTMVSFEIVGTTVAATGAIYTDGTNRTVNKSLGGGTSVANGTAPLWIGWRADSAANQNFLGGMAHVAIFDHSIFSDGGHASIVASATAEGWI